MIRWCALVAFPKYSMLSAKKDGVLCVPAVPCPPAVSLAPAPPITPITPPLSLPCSDSDVSVCGCKRSCRDSRVPSLSSQHLQPSPSD